MSNKKQDEESVGLSKEDLKDVVDELKIVSAQLGVLTSRRDEVQEKLEQSKEDIKLLKKEAKEANTAYQESRTKYKDLCIRGRQDVQNIGGYGLKDAEAKMKTFINEEILD